MSFQLKNPNYSRMRETYHELLDCYEHWDEIPSDEEKLARARILQLCEAIVYEHGEKVERFD